ncbi:ABC transporter substrate-binding protein [Nocardia sp. CA2R105]|uniref:ABC transporter substrate-binding protein n=1 Tax=Nocardia coffeae TaxID=2873381 RepID=UPI001CA6BB51|nr:ABC transporter substrate-binding protein [Nocardia coffeae]MBY8860986.1 ABC transporter substrate-binding protein [Nocardia coffeae]
MRRFGAIAAGLCSVALLVSACGGGAGANDPNGPLKIGVLTSLSGSSVAHWAQTESGVKARLAAYKDSGGTCASRRFDVVMADDQSTPQGALTATQRLVQQEKAFAVLPASSFFFGAGQYAGTQARTTPFLGGAFDAGAQWSNPKFENLFPAMSNDDWDSAATTLGDYWKKLGGTKVAVVGYNVPSSSKAAEGAAVSAEHAGLARGYVNERLQLGTTDVGATVLGIKDSGADVLYAPINPDTAFALVTGLHQAGVQLKSVLLATGYGSELLDSPPSIEPAQGVGFMTSYAPVELNTDATKAWSAALQKYAGAPNGIPSFSQAVGWLSADLLLHGLEKAGCTATQKQFISALRPDKTWTAGGLFTQPTDFEHPNAYSVGGPGDCTFITILRGNTFVPDPNGSPVCGKQIPGVKVTAK